MFIFSRTGTCSTLRPILPAEQQPFGGAGAGGRIQEFTWEGELVWDFKYFNEKQLPHHDVTKLPNGNILMIVWDRKTAQEAIAIGRRPEAIRDGHLTADCIVEIKPTGKTTGAVVWEWHVWDHLVQELDKTKANHGVVAARPELIDLNFGDGILPSLLANKDDADKLRGIGYLGGPAAPGGPRGPVGEDWTHINSVAYNPDLDEIVLSVHGFNEIWILDHSTTTAEGAGHTGGRRGKGGDLLYRWGNPRAYRSGTNADQRLFGQHSAHWIPKGLPGEGHLLVFNNGRPAHRREPTRRSMNSSCRSMPRVATSAKAGTAVRAGETGLEPFGSSKRADFYAQFISRGQSAPEREHLDLCSRVRTGTIFEVTAEKDIVWKYINPVKGGRAAGWTSRLPRLVETMLATTRETLKLTAEQNKKFDALQAEFETKVTEILSDEQKKQVKDPSKGPGSGGAPQAIRILPAVVEKMLKITPEQKKMADEAAKRGGRAARDSDSDERSSEAMQGDSRRVCQQLGSGQCGEPGKCDLPKLPLRRGLPRPQGERIEAGQDGRGTASRGCGEGR